MKQRIIHSTLLGALALSTMPVAAQSFSPEGTSFAANARVVSAVPVRDTVAAVPRQ